MHDFCFTLPYAFLLALGGLIGFLTKQSIPSLAGGGGSGLVLFLAGWQQLKAFKAGTNSWPAILAELVTSAVLTYVLGLRYARTGKVMPAGMVACLSGAMALFYLYKVATGGNKVAAPGKASKE